MSTKTTKRTRRGRRACASAWTSAATNCAAAWTTSARSLSCALKLAHTEYTHTEFEGDEVGTRVRQRPAPRRALELVHQPLGGLERRFGLQWGARDFSAVGEEAFVPASDARDAGLFWIGERDFGDACKLELGARDDRNRDRRRRRATAIGPDRDFNTTSASAGLKLGGERRPSTSTSASIARSARRAPRSCIPTACTWPPASFEFGTPDARCGNRQPRRTRPALAPRPVQGQSRRCTTCATTTSSTSPTPAIEEDGLPAAAVDAGRRALHRRRSASSTGTSPTTPAACGACACSATSCAAPARLGRARGAVRARPRRR